MVNTKKVPSMNPTSPTRLVIKAFLPAAALTSLRYQKAMRKYEHAPTPSQPRKVTNRLEPVTSISIEKANRLR